MGSIVGKVDISVGSTEDPFLNNVGSAEGALGDKVGSIVGALGSSVGSIVGQVGFTDVSKLKVGSTLCWLLLGSKLTFGTSD